MAEGRNYGRRFPLHALADAMGVELPSLGRRLGIYGSTWKKYRDEGVLEATADRLAGIANLPTLYVWPELADEVKRGCAGRGCDARFVPYRSNQRFCSKRCGNRERTRAALAVKRQDPDFREKERLRRRANYAESKHIEQRQQRRRYRTDPEYRALKSELLRQWRADPVNRERENAQARARYAKRRAAEREALATPEERPFEQQVAA